MITKLYLAKLEGHKKLIVDVRIFEHSNLVLSISKDEVRTLRNNIHLNLTINCKFIFVIGT